MESGQIYGILGGMGTAAGLLFQQIFFETCNRHGITGDQNYPEWLYLNASLAPDRTAAIKEEGPSPVPYLESMMKKMDAAGVKAVVVACNTAHQFYDEVFERVPIPWIHLQRETARAIRRKGLERVGILATEGTIRARLYHQALKLFGIVGQEPAPESDLQIRIMASIYDPEFGVKFTGSDVSDTAKKILNDAIDEMNVDAVVAGCTELSVAFSSMEMPVAWFDPMAIAAETLFDLWRGSRTVASLIQ
jgi:aspartate racemase